MPLTSNPYVLIATFVLSASIFRWLLVLRLGISKRAWRKAELLYLGAAAVSYFGISNGIRIESAKLRLGPEEVRARAMSRAFVNFTEGSPDELASSYCRPLIPSSEKRLIRLPNPSEEADRKNVCDWLIGIAFSNGVDPEHVDPSSLPEPPPARTDKTAILLSVYQPKLSEYKAQFSYVASLRDAARQSPVEKKFADWAPILAAVALGLRVAKVFGEMKDDKANAVSQPSPSLPVAAAE